MGRIVIAIAGPWTALPELQTDLELTFGPADIELAATLESVGRRAKVIDDRDVSAIQKHRGVIDVEADSAEAAAKLMVDAFDAGACAAYVETAVKVFGPGSLRGVDPSDRVALFHLFVEVWCDDAEVITEGMQAFDLPDVAVPFDGPAQAAAFALAAQMVCDGLRPEVGERFRASESAPWWVVGRRAADTEDAFANPLGYLTLALAEDQVG